jgi:hydrogenase maturation protease
VNYSTKSPDSLRTLPRALIVAYGNPLRSDDALAWIAAESLRARLPHEEVEILCLQQLGPELADAISRFECVIFVDAASSPGRPGEIQLLELPDVSAGSIPLSSFGHAVSPEMILRLGIHLYGAKPRAFSATIVGANFEHGESLSPAVRDAIPLLVSRIAELVESTPNRKRGTSWS